MLPKLSAANSQDSFVSKYLSPATRIQSSYGCATQKTPTKKYFMINLIYLVLSIQDNL